jgi:hypothetical protein
MPKLTPYQPEPITILVRGPDAREWRRIAMRENHERCQLRIDSGDADGCDCSDPERVLSEWIITIVDVHTWRLGEPRRAAATAKLLARHAKRKRQSKTSKTSRRRTSRGK